MSQKHIAYEFRRPCGCLRGAFVDTGFYTGGDLAACLGDYIVGFEETYVVRRELEEGELVQVGGPCPHGEVRHSAVSE